MTSRVQPTTSLIPLPEQFAGTRQALHRLACYVVAPRRRLRSGRIGLVPVAEGFGTPPLEDGRALVVREDQLAWHPGEATTITTLRAAAAFAGVELSADPGVGADLPPFDPDDPLTVHPTATAALAAWLRAGAAALSATVHRLSLSATERQLWPEHFDLATTVTVAGGESLNLGVSPGDDHYDEPYAYVGPHDLSGCDGPFWNAPFGAVVTYTELRATSDPHAALCAHFAEGVRLVRAGRAASWSSRGTA